ncbi:MAG: hypothetical protein IK129_04750 [Deltaproteobacteria bacterium]|nr:hypothetical protein [Deltaproteobacteria bacterium]
MRDILFDCLIGHGALEKLITPVETSSAGCETGATFFTVLMGGWEESRREFIGNSALTVPNLGI